MANLQDINQPVAWFDSADNVFYTKEDAHKTGFAPIRALYTTPQQRTWVEPSAWVHAGALETMINAGEGYAHVYPSKQVGASKPLYTTPQQRKPLTDEQIEAKFKRCGGRWNGDQWVIEDADFYVFVRTIEAATA